MSMLLQRFGRGSAVALALLIAITVSLAGVASAQDGTPIPYTPSDDVGSLSGSIESDGSSTVGPITEAVIEEFAAVASGVQVTNSISGTGGGFERFCAGETDIQNASRAIDADEVALCAAAGVSYYEFEVAYDGITIVVNPENDFVECLTTAQLAQLWGPDAVDVPWSTLNPEWSEDVTELYGPGTDSGTFDYFTAQINGEEGVSTQDFEPSEDDNQLVEGVAGGGANALGYFGYAYYEQNQDRLKVVAVDSGSGCVTPSPDTIRDGTYAPLSRPLYVYVTAESLTRPEVQEFFRFYLANAAVLSADVGYVASPVEAYLSDQAKLEAAIAGTGTPDGPTAAATPEA